MKEISPSMSHKLNLWLQEFEISLYRINLLNKILEINQPSQFGSPKTDYPQTRTKPQDSIPSPVIPGNHGLSIHLPWFLILTNT